MAARRRPTGPWLQPELRRDPSRARARQRSSGPTAGGTPTLRTHSVSRRLPADLPELVHVLLQPLVQQVRIALARDDRRAEGGEGRHHIVAEAAEARDFALRKPSELEALRQLGQFQELVRSRIDLDRWR